MSDAVLSHGWCLYTGALTPRRGSVSLGSVQEGFPKAGAGLPWERWALPSPRQGTGTAAA